MAHDNKRCLTCRRLDAERREDALGLVGVLVGVLAVCLLCLALSGC